MIDEQKIQNMEIGEKLPIKDKNNLRCIITKCRDNHYEIENIEHNTLLCHCENINELVSFLKIDKFKY